MKLIDKLENMTELGVFIAIKNHQYFIDLGKFCVNLGWFMEGIDGKESMIEYREIVSKGYDQLPRFGVAKKDATKWFLHWKKFVDTFDSEMWDIVLYLNDENIDHPLLHPEGDYKEVSMFG